MLSELLIAFPLAKSYMCVGGLDPWATDLTDHERLLALIEDLGPAVAAEFATAKRPGAYGKVKPREGFAWPWRVKKMRLWRLERLDQPLWLGEDGVIYRGEGPMANFDRPDFWQRAEIERRGVSGLERIVVALSEPDGPMAAPIALRRGNGVEM